MKRLAVLLLCCLPAAAAERRSGFLDMARETQALQNDDATNPAMLWVQEGEAMWAAPAGPAGQSCVSCHGEVEASMRGVAARYPAWDTMSEAPIDLAGRIVQCRVERQGASPLGRAQCSSTQRSGRSRLWSSRCRDTGRGASP